MRSAVRLLAVLAPALLACVAAAGAGRVVPATVAWDLAWTAGAIFAVVGMIVGRNASRDRDRTRWTWWLAAAGCWLVGQIGWDVQGLVGYSSLPSVADVGWWAFALCMVVALLRVRDGASRTERLVAAAEVWALAAATMALTFAELWPAAAASTQPLGQRLSAFAYPVTYVTAAIVTLHATTGGGLRRVSGSGRYLVLGGCVVQAVAFISWADQLLRNDYVIGATVVDPLWLVGSLMLGAGGLWAAAAPLDDDDAPEPFRMRGGLLPALVFMSLVAALLRAQYVHAAAESRLALALGLLMSGATLILRGELAQHRMAGLLARERVARDALAQREAELAELNERLSEDARRDPLTGMRNRRALTEDIVSLESLARLQARTFAIAVCDVDCFKAYNDHLGHIAGDRALREIGGAIRSELRVGDAAYRYGGEEIVLLLRDVGLEHAMAIAERVRVSVQRLGLPHPAGVTPELTISVGVAAGTIGSALLEAADGALYSAKSAGRNRVVAAGADEHGAVQRPREPLAAGERQLRGALAISRAGAGAKGPEPVLEALADFMRGEMGYQTVAVNLRNPVTDDFEVVHVLGDEDVRAALEGTRSPWTEWRKLLAAGEEIDGAVWIPDGGALEAEVAVWTPKHSSAIGPDAWSPEDMLLLPLRDRRGEVIAVVSVDEPLHGMRPDSIELRTLVAAAEHATLTLEHVAREGMRTDAPVTSPDVLLAAVMMLAETLDLRDAGTAEHSRIVGRYARETARALGLSADRVERLHAAGVLHDLGKVGLADTILRKTGPLDDAEWDEMRRHPEIGARILERAGLDDIATWVRCHHERLDGRGYPRRLEAHEIPLESRILAVVDAYEAMTADRPYRSALPQDEARAELLRGAGTQFDPEVVEAFLASGVTNPRVGTELVTPSG